MTRIHPCRLFPFIPAHPFDAPVHDFLALADQRFHCQFLSLDAYVRLRQPAQLDVVGKAEPSRAQSERLRFWTTVMAYAWSLHFAAFVRPQIIP
ncbi:hypothetical protein [uncultured Sulfitobacter sp.]|uniref:hypothetical protein n=1 Tax=uncultured Sulfitobacter sp. TaxID=191468 RepID=UPI0030F993B0